MEGKIGRARLDQRPWGRSHGFVKRVAESVLRMEQEARLRQSLQSQQLEQPVPVEHPTELPQSGTVVELPTLKGTRPARIGSRPSM